MKHTWMFVVNHARQLVFGCAMAVLVFALWNGGGISLKSHFVWGAALLPIAFLFFLQRREQLFSGELRACMEVSLCVSFLLFFASLFFTQTPGYGAQALVGFGSGVAVFFMVSRMPISRGEIFWFLKGLILLGVLGSILGGIAYVFQGFDRFAGVFWEAGKMYDAFPNAWANFSIMVLPLAVYFLFRAERFAEALLWILSSSSLAAGLLLTFSRGAWLALIILLIVSFWVLVIRPPAYRAARKGGIRAAFAVSLAVVFIFGLQFLRFGAQSFYEKATFQANEGAASVSERFSFWEGSLAMIRDRSFFGFGPDSFQFMYPKYQSDMLASSSHPHNMFLKTGVESGVFAMVFFAGFFILAAVIVLRDIHLVKSTRVSLASALSFSVIGGILHNMFDYNLNFVANALVFWMLLGLVFSFIHQAHSGFWQHLLHRRKRVLAWILLGIGTIAAYFSAHEVFYNYHMVTGRVLGEDSAHEYAPESFEAYLAAKPLYFPRELYRSLGQTALDAYKLTGYRQWLSRGEREMEIRLARAGSGDPLFYNVLGELKFSLGQTEAAEKLFSDAILRDGLNHLKFYYDLLSAWKTLGREHLVTAARLKIERLLTVYYEKLSDNAHLTILTDNPRYAILLCEFFGDKVCAERFSAEFGDEVHQFKDRFSVSL